MAALRQVLTRDPHWPAIYLLAVALPLAAILLTVRIGAPAFVFEHLIVLLVVALALIGGYGPAIVAAVTATAGDNILLREPIGRPAITGARDAADFALFLAVAATVGWLVDRLQIARTRAVDAAARERTAREERDRLVATITHDLATPLSAIQGTIQFARKHQGLSSIDFPRLLVRLETAAARATSLIRSLRDARSLAEHQLSLDCAPVDLRSIVEPTVQMLDRMSERHPIVFAMPATPIVVHGDAERLGRVVENLITNAIKYSPEGGPVEVDLADDRDSAVMKVADCGIGIPAADYERLFEAGFRVKETAGVAPGLGLGLYIAAEIVTRHGGTIRASPNKPKGTILTMRIPILARACEDGVPASVRLAEVNRSRGGIGA